MTHIVRTTMRPWLEIEVGDAEHTDLQRQNLLVEGRSGRAVSAAAGTKQPPKGDDTRGNREGE